MEYNEWTPVGRGDPLKNDPTYDYSPPVLDRVRYWDSGKDKSSDILLLGVSSKKTPTLTYRGNPKDNNYFKSPNNIPMRRNYYMQNVSHLILSSHDLLLTYPLLPAAHNSNATPHAIARPNAHRRDVANSFLDAARPVDRWYHLHQCQGQQWATASEQVALLALDPSERDHKATTVLHEAAATVSHDLLLYRSNASPSSVSALLSIALQHAPLAERL